jgi:glycosyltransferase involved in cell wall biosynthesis
MSKNPTNRLKVLYLPRWYPNRYDPMPGLFIERHARSVAPHADMAALYVHADDTMQRNRYEIDTYEDDELLQVKVYYKYAKGKFRPRNTLLNTLRFIKANRRGYKIIKEKFGQPDILHVNVLTRLGLLAWWMKLTRGIPYVITEHWTRYLPMTDTYHGWLRKQMTKMVVKSAAAVMPVTENLQRAMESYGLTNRNYKIIPNVVDMQMFRPSPTPLSKDKVQMVHVSCFEDKQKNISGLLRVLKRLSEQRQDWHMKMIGDGIHFERLVKLGEELGLKGTFVDFLGLKENEELAKLMAHAHFQVMFSRFENLPVVILESYACGVPVLSTNVGGIYEHMNEELGILIKSEDEEALYEKLNFMIENHTSYSKEKIRQYAVGHFSKEVIGEQLFGVYSEVFSKE